MVEKETRPWQRAAPPPPPPEPAPEPPREPDEPAPDGEVAPEPPPEPPEPPPESSPEPPPDEVAGEEPRGPAEVDDEEPLDAEYLDEEGEGEARTPVVVARRAAPAVKPESRVDQLPKRRWLLRTNRAYLRAALGALIGGAVPFVAWWLGVLPPRALWLVLIPMALGWLLFLPPAVYLAMDEQGVALIVKEWLRTNYLWIPAERLIRLGKDRGWLRAVGTTVEQEGLADWEEVARKAGATKIDSISQTFSRLDAGGTMIAAPFYMLDELSRDEIELYIFQQCKY